MQEKIKNFFRNKSVLVTGGTGSFGQQVSKHLLKYKVKKIIIFSRDELKQYNMQKNFSDVRIRYFIGDIRDRQRLSMALRGVNIVIHAAALKHVPKAELDPSEFIKTNILGSENVIYASIKNAVEHVMLISTDKAVNPINLYGSTKLCAEKLFIASNNIVGEQNIKFSISRYGNVINSRGSLIPLIHEKMKKNQMVYLTHKDMTRFFISLEDGVNFVLKNIVRMKGGEIFIPKMNSYRIEDLIKKITKQKKIKVGKLRVGEKIHEILIGYDESYHAIDFGKFYTIPPYKLFSDDKRDFASNVLGEKGKNVSKRFEYSSKDTNIINKLKV